jgi:hypothetical protein
MSIFTKSDAIISINPDSQFSYYHSPRDEIKWLSGDIQQPTEVEIDAKLAELQAEYDSQAYARDRITAYPSTGDQLDYIYHNGVAKWKTDMIDPVKTKYPKG